MFLIISDNFSSSRFCWVDFETGKLANSPSLLRRNPDFLKKNCNLHLLYLLTLLKIEVFSVNISLFIKSLSQWNWIWISNSKVGTNSSLWSFLPIKEISLICVVLDFYNRRTIDQCYYQTEYNDRKLITSKAM